MRVIILHNWRKSNFYEEIFMDDNTIEIRDDEVNVEKIMEKIRENILLKQKAGELPPEPDTLISSISCSGNSPEVNESIQRDLSYINSNWDIMNNSYFICSHHPYAGKFLVKGRQLVHGEVRRYVDPMFYKQTSFNQSTRRILNYLEKSDGELSSKITAQHDNTKKELERKIHKLENKFNELENKFNELGNKIDDEIYRGITAINSEIEKKTWLAQALEERIHKDIAKKTTSPVSTAKENLNYFLFEERFRGSRKDIKQQQQAFLQYFEKCSRVLDIGCGRGEFLEILKDHGIGGIGVDSDPDMVGYCRSLQLDVTHSDAIAFLLTLEDKSLDGIFIDQVAEHLEPDYLIHLLSLCHQKLKYGHYVVLETVNPLSLVSFFNFYLDMSHKKPVHPYTLKFLLDSYHFREIELKYYAEIPENAKLKKHHADPCSESERQFLEGYNYNINMLNFLLWGPMDYVVIGKK
jgi:O-antigen chain-terminating methyltransferase